MNREQIEKLLEGATDGSWSWDSDIFITQSVSEDERKEFFSEIAPWLVSDEAGRHPDNCILTGEVVCSEGNAALIAAAPALAKQCLELMEALSAEDKAEPYGWMFKREWQEWGGGHRVTLKCDTVPHGGKWVEVYTRPTPARLSAEEIEKLFKVEYSESDGHCDMSPYLAVSFANAIMDKMLEKGEGK